MGSDTDGPDLPRFGRFRATGELGAGAMGTVYRAKDDILGREVAIKTLHAHRSDSQLRERFFHEARAVGLVTHPNIVGIYDMGTEDGAPYLVMELATGGSLKDHLGRGRLSIEVVRGLGIQIAQALAAAHAQDILHRDIKPANILVTGDGTWKLADFGIARVPDSSLTMTGQFLGSPAYAAPESLTRGEFSAASDVYNLGATLYEALAGDTPYGHADLESLFRKVKQDPPELRHRVALPDALGAAIMATLARDPALRPSAAELARRLAEVTQPAAIVALPDVPGRIRWKPLAIGGLVAFALIVLIAATQGGGSPAIGARVAPPPASLSDPAPGIDAGELAADPDDGFERVEYLEREEPRGRGRGRGKHKKHDRDD
ncbi:MAG: serine/threonine-protein kinase [Kofleriaceae bacterium]